MKMILIVLCTILTIGLVSAAMQIGDNQDLPRVDITTPTVTNYTSSGTTTNSSIFWGIYNYADYNMPVIRDFAYNESTYYLDLWLAGGFGTGLNWNFGDNRLDGHYFGDGSSVLQGALINLPSAVGFTGLTSQLTNDVPFYKSGDNAHFATVFSDIFASETSPTNSIQWNIGGYWTFGATRMIGAGFGDGSSYFVGTNATLTTLYGTNVYGTNICYSNGTRCNLTMLYPFNSTNVAFVNKSNIFNGNQTFNFSESNNILFHETLFNGVYFPEITPTAQDGSHVLLQRGGFFLVDDGSNSLYLYFTSSDGSLASYFNYIPSLSQLKWQQGTLIIDKENLGTLDLWGKGATIAGNRRGGEIKWDIGGTSAGANTTAGFTFVNQNKQLVFKPTAQASSTDTGVAWVDLTNGNAQFSNLSIAGNINATGNVWIGGNLSVRRPYFNGYDNSTQTNNVVNGQVMNLTNNADYINWQINVTQRQNITFQQTGVYRISVSPEFFEPTGQSGVITFWFRKNNVDITGSNSRYTLSSNSYSTPEITTMTKITTPATDYVTIWWWSDNANTILYSNNSLTSPTRPSIPAVILNVEKVSEIT